MADRSNYADNPTGEYSPPVHKIFPHDFRRFTPHGGANGEHLHGHLGENSATGEHVLTRKQQLEAWRPTYKPNPHHPLCGVRLNACGCGRHTVVEASGKEEFQEFARAAHRAAGDYRRSATGTIS